MKKSGLAKSSIFIMLMIFVFGVAFAEYFYKELYINRKDLKPFPDLFSVMENDMGKTEEQIQNDYCLAYKEKDYSEHHYGDIEYHTLAQKYPKDAQSYIGLKNQTVMFNYKFSPKALFVAKNNDDETKVLTSVSYSSDFTFIENTLEIAKKVHEEILRKFPDASYSNEVFEEILSSREVYLNYFNEHKTNKYVYNVKHWGSKEYVKDGFRDICVLNTYTDKYFNYKITISVQSGVGKRGVTASFNIVYQSEELVLKYNGNELFYKCGEENENTEYFESELLALDF